MAMSRVQEIRDKLIPGLEDLGEKWEINADSCPEACIKDLAAPRNRRVLELEPVIHELAHLVTFPFTRPVSTSEISDVFNVMPPALANRFEIAAWVVERRLLTHLGVKAPYVQVALICQDSLSAFDKRSTRWILKLLRKWGREQWTKDAYRRAVDSIWRRELAQVPRRSLSDEVWEWR